MNDCDKDFCVYIYMSFYSRSTGCTVFIMVHGRVGTNRPLARQNKFFWRDLHQNNKWEHTDVHTHNTHAHTFFRTVSAEGLSECRGVGDVVGWVLFRHQGNHWAICHLEQNFQGQLLLDSVFWVMCIFILQQNVNMRIIISFIWNSDSSKMLAAAAAEISNKPQNIVGFVVFITWSSVVPGSEPAC